MKYQAFKKTGNRNAEAQQWGRPPRLPVSSLAADVPQSVPAPRHQTFHSPLFCARRGSALILVVVLVLLLAMMGTTFLFVMRAARLQAGGPGSGNLMQGTWPTVPQSGLDTAIDAVKVGVQNLLTIAVRPVGVNQYLLPTNPESSYTHPVTGNTLYLSDRFPVTEADRTVGGDSRYIMWRFISVDPNPGHGGDRRNDLYASQFRVTYPTGNWPLDALGAAYPPWAKLALSGRTRFFPSMMPSPAVLTDVKRTDMNPATRFLAGDADGDGIVDCRLSFLSSSNGYDYWTGIRIVDNNAAVNVNTAWRSTADRDFTNPAIDISPANPLTGYLGTFRSNIGLYEMLIGSPVDKTDVVPPASVVLDADTDLKALDTFRFGNIFPGLKNIYTGNDAAAAGTLLAGVEYLTVADALEHGMVRRLDQITTKTGFYAPNNRFKTFDDKLTHDQLVSRFSLVSPNFTNTQLTANLPKTDLAYAPNTWNNAVVQQFQFYGANQSDYWYHTTLSTDSATGTPREKFLGYAGTSDNYPNAFSLVQVLKTIRPHLVGENGVTVSAPFVAAPAAGLVATSPTPADWSAPNFLMADYATDTPRKAWANGASFGELWRAYYSLFKAAAANPFPIQTTNFNTGNNAMGSGLPAWAGLPNRDKQVLLRAAIAATNTLQARLPAAADVLVQKVTIGGTAINVFGAKRQPFITEVMVETGRKDPGNLIEVKWVAIELHNPYNVAISLAREQLFFVSGGVTWTLGADLAGQGTIPAGGFKTIVAKRTGYVDTGSPVNGLAAIANPGNDAIINNFPITTIGGASLRLVAWDGTTAATVNGYDMIPQDEVGDFGSLPIDLGFPQRFRYVRPTLTASGSRFNCVYNAPAAFTKITDTAATAPATWDATLDGTLNAENPGVANTKDDLVIQVGNYSTFKPASIVGNAFPFQGFARDGDLLSVAFIGNYAYLNAATPYTCSVTKDAFYAEDADATDDAYEAVGRFAPLSALNFGTIPVIGDTYAWAARLFDFVTAIQHPGKDNTNPLVGSDTNPDSPPELVIAGKESLSYTGRSIQGKLNINTASWQALAALPLVPVNPQVPASSTAALAASQTVKLAKHIVDFRDGLNGLPLHGPFKSIFELNLVPDFAWLTAGVGAATDLTTADLNIAGIAGTGVGDLSPLDNAKGDFEQRLLGLTRISNLITTRSDSFTVYIVVQAWITNAPPDTYTPGSPPPIMVAEKRAAFVMDRTGLTQDPTTVILPRQLKDRP